MRVLVLDSGPTSSYHVMRSLALAGHEVHLASGEPTFFFSSKYCERAIESPAPTDRAAYGQFLVDTVKTGDYGLLYFCGEDEAELVWDLRSELEPYVQCFVPDHKWKHVAFNKREAYRHVAQLGLRVPTTVQPTSLDDVDEVERTLAYPVVVKGNTGSAGRLVRFALDRQQLLAKLAQVAALAPEGGVPTVQEYLPGPAYVVHALFNQGEPLALCSHRKDRDLPVGRGVTSAATTVHLPALDRAALWILRSLEWHGLAKMDFKLDERDGRFKFIELDPRVSASIDITRAAGADQAVLLCNLASGKPVPRQSRVPCRRPLPMALPARGRPAAGAPLAPSPAPVRRRNQGLPLGPGRPRPPLRTEGGPHVCCGTSRIRYKPARSGSRAASSPRSNARRTPWQSARRPSWSAHA